MLANCVQLHFIYAMPCACVLALVCFACLQNSNCWWQSIRTRMSNNKNTNFEKEKTEIVCQRYRIISSDAFNFFSYWTNHRGGIRIDEEKKRKKKNERKKQFARINAHSDLASAHVHFIVRAYIVLIILDNGPNDTIYFFLAFLFHFLF